MDEDPRLVPGAEGGGDSAGSPADETAPSVPLDNQPETAAFDYLDDELDDFEGREEWSPYFSESVKLSRGPFRGRWTSAYARNGALVAHWSVNCGMYQHAGIPEGWFGFTVPLGPPGTRINGVELDRNSLTTSGPGSELEVDLPPEGGEFLILSVHESNLERSVCEGTNLGRIGLERGMVSSVRREFMARALAENTLALLGILGREPDLRLPESAPTTLFAAVVEGLDLESHLDGDHGGKRCKPSFATFAEARQALAGMATYDAAALAAAVGRSSRAIQMAFAEHARMTPSRYFNSLKLHRARTALQADPGDRAATIGDIAMTHGFQDWSRFARMYRQQFGETPSRTRARRGPPATAATG